MRQVTIAEVLKPLTAIMISTVVHPHSTIPTIMTFLNIIALPTITDLPNNTLVNPYTTVALRSITARPNSTMVNVQSTMALRSITALPNSTMVNVHSTTALPSITYLPPISIPMKTIVAINTHVFILSVSVGFRTMSPHIRRPNRPNSIQTAADPYRSEPWCSLRATWDT
jgi:hypothetical protein